jgi:hypothetical protein
MTRTWTVVIAGLLLVSRASSRETTIKLTAVELDKTPFITPLIAPGATCAAVGENVGKVAIGQKVEKEAQVSLFPVDDLGKLAGAPISFKLPKPATLAQREAYPISLVFHPTLPLLYVWQDVKALPGDPIPLDPVAWKEFDHLLIYSVQKVAPELLLSLCRGQAFQTGNIAGSLHIDVASGRLYVPNLRFGEKNPPEKGGGVGWFTLAGDGLPIAGDEEPAKVEPPSAPAKAVADWPAHLTALRALVAAGKPLGAFRHTPPDSYGFGAHPAGAGFVTISRDVFIASGYLGPMTWNLADRGSRCQVFLMPVNFISYYSVRIAGHPRLPVVFASIVGYSYAHRAEHADGYFTLVPQVLTLEGTTLKTPPIVMAKQNLVAFGGPGAIYLAAIDAEGKFKDAPGTQVNVPVTVAEGLAYSEKFDRLYVAVEKAK